MRTGVRRPSCRQVLRDCVKRDLKFEHRLGDISLEFLLAIQFLTKVSINIGGLVTEKNLARAMAFFPLVGLLLGALAAILNFLLSSIVTPVTADLVAIAFLVIITGNLHGDGLMDTADGLFSGRPREGMLSIMKDSRVGSHGVIAGSLALLCKFVLLSQLPQMSKVWALLMVPALGRWAQVYAATVYPYARSGGGTGGFTQHVKARELIWGSLTVLVPLMLIFSWRGSLLAVGVLIGVTGVAHFIAGKIGGMTGDTLGALSECTEVLALFTLQIILRNT